MGYYLISASDVVGHITACDVAATLPVLPVVYQFIHY